MIVPPRRKQIDEYQVISRLGRGSMGTVYQAEGPDGREVAVKVLTRTDEMAVERFRREARLGRELEHPNVVRILASRDDEEFRYLVMELLRGRTVHSILKRENRLPGGLVKQVAEQLAEGLTAFHTRKLIHRDIKPANLMVTNEGRLVIMDLGLVRDPDLEGLTRVGSVLGTPSFMAPEQARGETASLQVDLFAMTMVLFRILTGRHPFRKSEHRDVLTYLDHLLNAEPDPWHEGSEGGPLDRFFGRALEKDPEMRYASAQELHDTFLEALSEERRRRGQEG